jgi:hypothetical protein
MTNLPEDAMLLMNWFEAGILRGVLEKNHEFDKLPKSLQLKLNILFSQAYVGHPTLGKQAKKDIEKYRQKLLIIQNKNGGEKK